MKRVSRATLLRGVWVAAVALTTVLAVRWMRDQSDTVHVVVVTWEEAPGARREASVILDELARHAVVLEQAFVSPSGRADADAVRPGVRRALATIPRLLESLRLAGWRNGAFLSGSALAAAPAALARHVLVLDDASSTQGVRAAPSAASAAIGWLKGEAHERPPNGVWVHFDGRQVGPSALDRSLERLLAALREHGFWEQTLLLVIGAPLEAPRRENDSTRGATLLLRLPGDRYAGMRVADAVGSDDVLATLGDVLRLDALASRGRSALADLEPR